MVESPAAPVAENALVSSSGWCQLIPHLLVTTVSPAPALDSAADDEAHPADYSRDLWVSSLVN